MIKANALILVMRVNDYKDHQFFKDHDCVMKDVGYVWMLKVGKRIPELRMQDVLKGGGHVIFRGSKASGGKYYYAHVEEVKYGTPDVSMVFPEYYCSMVSDPSLWTLDSLDGTWLKLTSLQEMRSELIQNIKLISNGKSVDEAMKSSMTSFVYAKSTQDLVVD